MPKIGVEPIPIVWEDSFPFMPINTADGSIVIMHPTVLLMRILPEDESLMDSPSSMMFVAA